MAVMPVGLDFKAIEITVIKGNNERFTYRFIQPKRGPKMFATMTYEVDQKTDYANTHIVSSKKTYNLNIQTH